MLRKDYDPFFADNASMAFKTTFGDTVAEAILTVEPDDPKARRALRLGRGPLFDVVTRDAVQYRVREGWLRILLLHQQAASPPPAPAPAGSPGRGG